jgi:hypothetical protein
MQDKNGNPLVPLPPVEQIVVPVTLSAEARVESFESNCLIANEPRRICMIKLKRFLVNVLKAYSGILHRYVLSKLHQRHR